MRIAYFLLQEVFGVNINKESYDKICDRWHEYRSRSAINRCVAEFCAYLKPHAHVLDIGCGTGYPVAAYLAEQGFSVTGIDISEKMIEKAKALRLPRADFMVKDVLAFKPAEKYDGVIAFDSLWHVPMENQAELYGLIASFMKVGGYFLFTHGKTKGSVSGEMYGEMFYYSALNREDVHKLLNNNGFRLLSSVENYAEETTGDRELLIAAEKVR